MSFLLDTHLLLWFAGATAELTQTRRAIIEDADGQVCFSVISLWEIVIKHSLRKDGFAVDAEKLRANLLARGFAEVAFTAGHALQVAALPQLHKDPFDRALIAQAQSEGLTLLTADDTVARYYDTIWKV